MANIINTAIVVDPNKLQPLTTKSVDFIQDNIVEQTAIAAGSHLNFMYGAASIYAVKGCEKIDLGGGYYQFNSGYILSTNTKELFYFAGTSSIHITSQPILDISTTYDATADPITFTDGSVQNIHQVRTATIRNGSFGSGSLDNYANLYFGYESYESNDQISISVSGTSAHNLDYGVGQTSIIRSGRALGHNFEMFMVDFEAKVVVSSGTDVFRLWFSLPTYASTLYNDYGSCYYTDGTNDYCARIYGGFSGGGSYAEIWTTKSWGPGTYYFTGQYIYRTNIHD